MVNVGCLEATQSLLSLKFPTAGTSLLLVPLSVFHLSGTRTHTPVADLLQHRALCATAAAPAKSVHCCVRHNSLALFVLSFTDANNLNPQLFEIMRFPHLLTDHYRCNVFADYANNNRQHVQFAFAVRLMVLTSGCKASARQTANVAWTQHKNNYFYRKSANRIFCFQNSNSLQQQLFEITVGQGEEKSCLQKVSKVGQTSFRRDNELSVKVQKIRVNKFEGSRHATCYMDI